LAQSDLATFWVLSLLTLHPNIQTDAIFLKKKMVEGKKISWPKYSKYKQFPSNILKG
jgi:hypothetical protein